MAESEKLSISQQKKVNRKLNKLQHILKKETEIAFSATPTKNLVICNAGLVNGLTEERIYENFNKYGPLTEITLLTGKSYCFVSYKILESAVKAHNAFNGKLNIAQDNKAIYLLYAERLPDFSEQKIWGEVPSGLFLLKNFITNLEEDYLLCLCNFEHNILGNMRHRLVKHFGFEFRYDINNVDKDQPLKEKIPPECDFLWKRLAATDLHCNDFIPNQLTVNHYLPGQGIPHHVDTHSAFEDPIVCLSLGSPTVMEFKNREKHVCVLLPQRSLLIMSGESRYDWTHGIVPRKFDVIKGQTDGFTSLKRGTRVSFTFRKVLQGDCACSYKTKCDSFKKSSEMMDNVASKLEKLHVHGVYEKIADHFSDTRHKPWPNVLDFVQSFGSGALLVDVGCGNGKYLGLNKHIYNIGCDRSLGLIEICKEKNYEAFVGDCLAIPLKDDIADGVISIAVIHHLANEVRRLRAIKEIIRVLKIGGKALIYVWAQDQNLGQEKSGYIKQDRKNRKSSITECTSSYSCDKMSVLDGSISLPVHTNRTQFQAQDVLVPWKLKNENKTTFLRYYHVFDERELETLCEKVENASIKKSYYDQGNWCLIVEKISIFKTH